MNATHFYLNDGFQASATTSSQGPGRFRMILHTPDVGAIAGDHMQDETSPDRWFCEIIRGLHHGTEKATIELVVISPNLVTSYIIESHAA